MLVLSPPTPRSPTVPCSLTPPLFVTLSLPLSLSLSRNCNGCAPNIGSTVYTTPGTVLRRDHGDLSRCLGASGGKSKLSVSVKGEASMQHCTTRSKNKRRWGVGGGGFVRPWIHLDTSCRDANHCEKCIVETNMVSTACFNFMERVTPLSIVLLPRAGG